MSLTEVEINEKDTVNTTTSIPRVIRDYIRNKNWKTNELIRMGILAKEDNPQLIDRIAKVERDIEIIFMRLEVWKDIIENSRKTTMDTQQKV